MTDIVTAILTKPDMRTNEALSAELLRKATAGKAWSGKAE